jgi:hypothetical protein
MGLNFLFAFQRQSQKKESLHIAILCYAISQQCRRGLALILETNIPCDIEPVVMEQGAPV